MIDIHCHILPNVDDGAEHEKSSLGMARMAVQEGITKIIATPHYNRHFINTKIDIIEKVKHLNHLFKNNDIPLTIYPGQEPRITGDMVEDLNEGHLLTLNNTGKYLFVELPSNHIPHYTKNLLYKLQVARINPIIAHPERNSEIIEKPELLYDLVSNGIFTQVTAASVIGHFGKKIKKFSFDLIDHSLTHFIASDAHNVSKRAFHFAKAYEEIEKRCSSDQRKTFEENAEKVISGENIVTETPEQIKKKWLRFF